MKKLLFVATASLCATVFGAIESSNVVGYQTKTLEDNGFTQLAPTFETIGSEGLKLKDLTGSFSEMDSVQVFDDIGDVETEIFWLVSGSMAPGETGWYNDSFESADNVGLNTGKGFWINTQGEASATMSGAVRKEATDVVLGPNFTAIGNSSPVDKTLSDFTFEGLTEMDSVQIFNKAGNVETEIFWLVSGSMAPGETGWYNDSFEPAGDTEIKAGTAFWVNRLDTSSNGKATIPAAL